MGDRRKCQTYTASPAEPGGLPVMLDVRVNPAARRARAVDESSALRGRGERRVPVAPAASCAMIVVERTRVTTSTPESPGIPARNGFNGFLRALVSTKSARMCERAVLTNRPSLDLSPFRA